MFRIRLAWWAAIHRVAKSRTQLSDFTFTFHFHALEKEMATHSSVLAWRIPGTGEPDGLPSMGSHRVGHDWSDLAATVAAAGVHWRDWCWGWNYNTLATSCEELTHWKRLWCWEWLGAGEGDDRGWDGWMASLTRWAWVWVNSGSWWWTGRPGVLRFMGSQRVGHNWVTELNWMPLFTSIRLLAFRSTISDTLGLAIQFPFDKCLHGMSLSILLLSTFFLSFL